MKPDRDRGGFRILAELEVEDVLSVLETHPDLYQVSYRCLRKRRRQSQREVTSAFAETPV
jgi:hypothetical protein